MRHALTFCLLTLSLSFAAGARAQAERLVLVELFTSQGCSSCPPADAMLAELSEYERVLPLSLHVDYWDYLGWHDQFARPEWSARQEAYARAHGKRSVYTPQAIVDGGIAIVGSRGMAVMDAVDERRSLAPELNLTWQPDGSFMLRALADMESVSIDLVRYKPMETVHIAGGENAGRSLRYINIVTGLQVLGQWSAEAGAQSQWSLPEMEAAPMRYAIIVQDHPVGTVRGVWTLD